RGFLLFNVTLMIFGGMLLILADYAEKQLPSFVNVEGWQWVFVLAHGGGEALVVASILALSVDEYLKRRLAKELSEEVIDRTSTYLMSFDLPRELQDDIDHLC